MTITSDASAFAGSVPSTYAAHLVPLLFEPYAADIAARVAALNPSHVLEIAAGTGAVTRALAGAMPHAAIVATDLNQAMLDEAAKRELPHAVQWRVADAMQLPFDDATFDVVVCQFGAMFFPDKPRAFAQAHRVLRTGGSFVFNVWDELGASEIASIVSDTVAGMFPDDRPTFFARVPHGYSDTELIVRDLVAGGFTAPASIVTVDARARADSARLAAIGFCQGTPLYADMVARDASKVEVAIDAVTANLVRRFGKAGIDTAMRALVVTATKTAV